MYLLKKKKKCWLKKSTELSLLNGMVQEPNKSLNRNFQDSDMRVEDHWGFKKRNVLIGVEYLMRTF